MILAVNSHIGAILLIDFLSIIFIAYTIKRISFGKVYEDSIDKKVLSFFLVGILLFAVGIVADMFNLLGMSSYLINNKSAMVFKTIAPFLFFMGAYYLQKHK